MMGDGAGAARPDGVVSTTRASRPYYVPIANEEQVFKAAFRQGMSVVLKGPTGCGKTRFLDSWRDLMIWGLLEEDYPNTPASQTEIKVFDAFGRSLL